MYNLYNHFCNVHLYDEFIYSIVADEMVEFLVKVSIVHNSN